MRHIFNSSLPPAECSQYLLDTFRASMTGLNFLVTKDPLQDYRFEIKRRASHFDPLAPTAIGFMMANDTGSVITVDFRIRLAVKLILLAIAIGMALTILLGDNSVIEKNLLEFIIASLLGPGFLIGLFVYYRNIKGGRDEAIVVRFLEQTFAENGSNSATAQTSTSTN